MSADAAAPPKKSSSKLVLVALLALLVGGGGAGGAWWFLGREAPNEEELAHAEERRKADEKPVFAVLEPFTVNLRDERGERFAQIGVTLQIVDSSVDALIKDRLPAVRNNILLLISSKRIEDLLTPEGKKVLAEEVRLRAGEALGWKAPAPVAAAPMHDEVDDRDADDGQKPAKRKRRKPVEPAPENPIRQVLFSQFIVQ